MTDWNKIRNLLKQKQEELKTSKVNISTRMLREGIQNRPQRQKIGTFNRQLLTQSGRYDEQISDIDRFLLEKEENNVSSPEPNINFFNPPELKKLRSRFKRKGVWF